VLAAWTAALVARRAATQRLVAASRTLDAESRPVAEPWPSAGSEPGGLDAALDHLEQSVAHAVERRSRVASAVDRLSWALGAIGHGVVIFDERGEVVYRNDPAASFLAARHSDALVEEAISVLAADALRGRRVERELELFGPPRRILNIRAVPLADPARPSGVLVVVEDTSERRRLENVRRDFVANISHVLKTPVGALALLAETLLDERDPDVTRRLAERLANGAFRVGRRSTTSSSCPDWRSRPLRPTSTCRWRPSWARRAPGWSPPPSSGASSSPSRRHRPGSPWLASAASWCRP
jgi:PAS domain-containing protein